MDLSKLKQEIPFKWKIQSFNRDQTKASCVAYIDARDVMNLLDEVVGAENWQDEYYQVKDTMFCKLSIATNYGWVSKSDGGAESDNASITGDAKTKGEPSDAFKRAAVKWGIGRFLYNKEIKWVNVNQYKKPVDEQGNIIWNLTSYFNGQQPNKTKNAVNILKLKLSELGAKDETEALDMIDKHSGVKMNEMSELTEDKAKAILEFFNE